MSLPLARGGVAWLGGVGGVGPGSCPRGGSPEGVGGRAWTLPHQGCKTRSGGLGWAGNAAATKEQEEEEEEEGKEDEVDEEVEEDEESEESEDLDDVPLGSRVEHDQEDEGATSSPEAELDSSGDEVVLSRKRRR